MSNPESVECEVIGNTSKRSAPQVSQDTTTKKIVGIYGLQNKTNGKWYIGQSLDIYQRWNDAYRLMHCEGQQKIHRALKKYGYDGFDKIILETCTENVDILNDREEFWTLHYDSIKNGYNIRLGGRSPMFGRHHTESHKRNMSEKMKGRKYSQESIQKMSAAATGRRHTEDTKQKMRIAWERRKLQGNIISDEGRKKIADTHRGKVFSMERRQRISDGIKNAWRRRKLDNSKNESHTSPI